jgi:hypothetical protein
VRQALGRGRHVTPAAMPLAFHAREDGRSTPPWDHSGDAADAREVCGWFRPFWSDRSRIRSIPGRSDGLKKWRKPNHPVPGARRSSWVSPISKERVLAPSLALLTVLEAAVAREIGRESRKMQEKGGVGCTRLTARSSTLDGFTALLALVGSVTG